ncbi:MAG: zinc-ribbon domain-containing protein [Lachnospiraceae bacterium]|nr:zinc-ribbon domain-containing protein [Lachnospiraceae bacterium]
MKESLVTGKPELIPEWSEKNMSAPADYTLGSSKKVWWKGQCGHEWQAIVKNRVHGSGCPYCTSIKLLKGFNDLESNAHGLAAEWSDRNGTLKPDMVMCKSNKSVWWKGGCGHEWKAKIADRYEGHGCPYCAGKILAGYNDLATTRPAIMDEWSDRNEINPAEVSESSYAVVWWICRDCGYEWRARISTRCKGGNECPDCRKEISIQNYLAMLESRKLGRRRKRTIARRSIAHYIKKSGLSILEDYDPDIGVPLSLYLPDRKLAIEFSNKRESRKKEYVKNLICKRIGIIMVRILDPGVASYDNCYCITRQDDSCEVLNKSIRKVLYILGIDIF